jgi:hypothetical protein
MVLVCLHCKFYLSLLGEKSGPLDKHNRRMKMRNTDAFGYNAEFSDPLYKHVFLCFIHSYIFKLSRFRFISRSPNLVPMDYSMIHPSTVNSIWEPKLTIIMAITVVSVLVVLTSITTLSMALRSKMWWKSSLY